MTETTKTNASETTQNLSEAERMSRIRDLLVGPVIADETARRDQSVSRLDHAIAGQSESIAALKARIGDLERAHRAETERLNLRLLGLVETLLTDEQTLRSRLSKSDHLKFNLGDDAPTANGTVKSG